MKTTGTPWPHILTDLEAKRTAIDEVIAIVRNHFVDDDQPGRMPEASKAFTFTKARLKKPKARRMARVVRPVKVVNGMHSEAILAALEAHDGSMLLRDLAKATGAASTTTLNYRMQTLVKAKTVILSGVTAGRRASLPGRMPKEVP